MGPVDPVPTKPVIVTPVIKPEPETKPEPVDLEKVLEDVEKAVRKACAEDGSTPEECEARVAAARKQKTEEAEAANAQKGG